MKNGYDEGRASIDGVDLPFESLIMNIANGVSGAHLHYHEYIELLFLLEGRVNIWINGVLYDFSPGDLAVINSNESHEMCGITEKSTYIVVKFLPQILYSSQQSVFELKYVVPFVMDNAKHQRIFKSAEIADTDIRRLITNISDEWHSKKFGYELAVRADIINVFVCIMRYWNSQGIIADSVMNEGDINQVVQNALDYTAQNYRNITEKQVAEHCNISYSYFSRSFKKIMKMNFSEYLNYLRINEAQKLLISTKRTITDIAMDLGYSTASHFISQFKKRKGVSPKRFRTDYENVMEHR